MKTRVIGLGNTLLTDDGVGIYVAREVRRRLDETGLAGAADVVESEVGGFALMELMAGWDRVILVDSIQFDGVRPGTLVQIDPEDLRTSLRIRSVHDVDLPTAMRLGRRLGFPMPEEIVVFGIQAEDARTFAERLTHSAMQGMQQAVSLVLNQVKAETC
jgi:hydrogenase maturation protease